MLKFIIKLIPIILLLVLCCFGIGVYDICSRWKRHSKGATIKLTFSQFEKMYNVAPARYELSNERTIYRNGSRLFSIFFSFSDYNQYLHWLQKLKSDGLEAKSVEAKQEYMRCVHEDIESFKEELEEGIQTMRELHL